MTTLRVSISPQTTVPSVPDSFRVPDLPFNKPCSLDDLEMYEHLGGKKNIVIIGQGGSVSSIRTIAGALPASSNFEIVDIQDPHFLHKVKESVKDDVLVVSISKSGNTLSVLQNTAYFNGLPMLIITEEEGALWKIASNSHIPCVHHPAIGGRFIGTALPCLLPAALGGIDVAGIIEGANSIYANAFNTNPAQNVALKIALILHEAEKNGLVDVYLPIYDSRFSCSAELIFQLCHETYCKSGNGHTILAVQAPECEHHTNQRYFGGPKNMFGFFVSVKDYRTDSSIHIPDAWKNVSITGSHVGKLDNVSHAKALYAELAGVMSHADHAKMPYIHLEVADHSPQSVGAFIALWQLVAVYGAVLRGVDPFDQPEVEFAKNATRKLLL